MSRHDPCVACEGPFGFSGQSIPVDNNGEIVANDYTGEWAGSPACKPCFDVHAAAGPIGLAAHLKASESLRADLTAARSALRKICREADHTLRSIGE